MRARLIALGFVWVVSITGALWAIGANGSQSANGVDVSFEDAQGKPLEAPGSRKVLGAWLFAITGTAVVLRSHKSRSI